MPEDGTPVEELPEERVTEDIIGEVTAEGALGDVEAVIEDVVEDIAGETVVSHFIEVAPSHRLVGCEGK